MEVEPINQLADDVLFVLDLSRDAESLAPPWGLAEALLRARGLESEDLFAELSKVAMVDATIRAKRFEARRLAMEREHRAHQLKRDLEARRSNAPRK